MLGEYLLAAARGFIRKHPLPCYFTLTFVLSWGCIVLAVWASTGGLTPTPEQFRATVPITVPAMLLGPGVAGLLLTGVVSGRAGYRELGAGLLKWRVPGRWYAVGLLVAPVTMGGVVLGLWLVSGDYAPGLASSGDVAGMVIVGVVLGLVVGLLEEIGWTGFAIPRALQRYTILGTGVLVGILWSAWHFFVSYWGGSGANGGIAVSVFMSLWLVGLLAGQLTAYRVLMVWVYERTRSLLLVVLMHASLTTFQFILNPLTPGWPQQIYGLGYAITAWVIVAAVGASRKGESSAGRSAAWVRAPGQRPSIEFRQQ